MTVLYAPDADVLALFQRLRMIPQVTAGGPLPVIVTDVVWDELTGERVQAPHREEARGMLQIIAGQPTMIEPASAEADTFNKLHDSPAAENAGEHSILAYVLHHKGVVPVFRDRRALHRAVEELRGEPVLSVHGFFDALWRNSHFSVGVLTELGRRYRERYSDQAAPLWWSTSVFRAIER